jgi:hypothetical protein
MCAPRDFGFNPETAATNVFQQPEAPADDPRQAAMAEFDASVAALCQMGVRVRTVEPGVAGLTDGVFPNNWFSVHPHGQGLRLLLYPMLSEVRRRERSALPQVLAALPTPPEVIDLSGHEAHGRFLEGTGSIVFDHLHRVAYAALSERTHPEVLREVCDLLGYRAQPFSAEALGVPVYHTNVVMSVGTGFAVVCLEVVAEADREALRESLERTGRTVIQISLAQMLDFCGNVLEVAGSDGPVLVMSERARASFTPDQLSELGRHATICSFAIPVIERLGGGSARCMLAELFS